MAQLLLDQVDHWLPSVVARHTSESTSNRVEGMNAVLKVATGHKRQPLLIVVKAVRIAAIMFRHKSENLRLPRDEALVEVIGGQELIGKAARQLLQKIFKMAQWEFPPGPDSVIGSICSLFGIPCPSEMAARIAEHRIPFVDLSELAPRCFPDYVRPLSEDQAPRAPEYDEMLPVVRPEEERGYRYGQVMGRLEPFLLVAAHDPEVREIFEQREDQLDEWARRRCWR
jgi:hypothetical protein